MLRGWFDAFRVDGGPTLYSTPNRTPVVEDIRNILIYVSFSTLFVAFLLILPGIRKERISTLIVVTTSLFVGAVILLTNYGTDWHVAEASINAPYRAFSRERLYADVSVRIGLNSVNVTLQASPIHKNSEDINYNERFNWVEATQLKTEFRAALVKGLPFPILTIAEYLSQNLEGFSWGGKYRKAGYYTCILLWTSFAMWLVMNILLCMVPRYGSYAMVLIGVLLLCCNGVYALLLPKVPLAIQFEMQVLSFTFGWCYWTIMVAGIFSITVGSFMSILDNFFPNKFSTIFEVDYDTPYRYFVGQDTTVLNTPIKPAPPLREHASLKSSPSTPQQSSSSRMLMDSSPSTPQQSSSSHLLMIDSSPSTPQQSSSSRMLRMDSSPSTPQQSHSSRMLMMDSPSSVTGLINDAYDTDDEDMVNGKRAVSLKNFGKFAQKGAGRKNQIPALQKKIFSGPHLSVPVGKQIAIDMKNSSKMW